MLIADRRYDEAEACIGTIKSIDPWISAYMYDEVELLYRKDKDAAIKYMEEQLEGVIDSIIGGIGSIAASISGFSEAGPELKAESRQLKKRLLDFCLKGLTHKRKKALRE